MEQADWILGAGAHERYGYLHIRHGPVLGAGAEIKLTVALGWTAGHDQVPLEKTVSQDPHFSSSRNTYELPELKRWREERKSPAYGAACLVLDSGLVTDGRMLEYVGPIGNRHRAIHKVHHTVRRGQKNVGISSDMPWSKEEDAFCETKCKEHPWTRMIPLLVHIPGRY